MEHAFDKEHLLFLKNILQNYRKNFYVAISEQQNILEKITNLPVYFVDNGATANTADLISLLNQKLAMQVAKLSKINSSLLKIKNIDELIFCIKKYNVLNLDKDVVVGLEKQEKLLKSCEAKGFITNTTLKGFEQTCILTNSLFLSSINQIEICEGYINNYLKNSNTTINFDDLEDEK